MALLILVGLTACGAGDEFAAPPADALFTASGLASKVLRVGLGERHPTARSVVTVHYTGWTSDGEMFETSVGGTPPSFPLNRVIPGWTEGVQLMLVGEKRRFWIPEELAYGSPDTARDGAPTGMLVFDIELIAID
jgi:FKBP-type peptidyl-prolyl cis-trans isomerase